jgi:hypothetical protein
MLQHISPHAYLTTENVAVRESATSLSTLQLKKLLHDLKAHSNACIRLRLIGRMWDNSFCHIHAVTDRGVILYKTSPAQMTEIGDVRQVIQFEIDRKYQNIQPHYHYGVTLSPET